MSRTGPCSPASTARATCGVERARRRRAGRPAWRRGMPSSAGSNRVSVDRAVPHHPDRWTGRWWSARRARRRRGRPGPSTPRSAKTPAMIGGHPRVEARRPPGAAGLAGLVSGPRKLNTVGTPSSLRGDRGVAQRRVVQRGEAEGDAASLDALGRPARAAGRSPTPSCLQHVGGAAGGRRRPVAVLDHAGAGGRRHDGGHRRDVDRVGAVAAGADHVDGRARDVDPAWRARACARPGRSSRRRSRPWPAARPRSRRSGHGGAAPAMISSIAHSARRRRGPRRARRAARSAGQVVGAVGTGRRSSVGSASRQARDRAPHQPGDGVGQRDRVERVGTTASARDQVASQPSSRPADQQSTGGQS